jgi:hypothetical protein
VRTLFLSVAMIVFAAGVAAQTQQGTILKWDVEAYGKRRDITQNAAVYYVQIGDNVYQVTQGSTKPGANASNVGKTVQCRVEKNRLVIIDDRGKEQRYNIIGVTQAK